MKVEEKTYASASWDVSDIQSRRPNWPAARCEEWLAMNERRIADAMVGAGWGTIDDILGEEDQV